MAEPLSAAARVAAEINRIVSAGGRLGDDAKLQETLQQIQDLDRSFEEKGGVFFHTGSDAFETAERFTQIHLEQYRKTGRPSLPALAIHHAEKIGLDKTSAEYKALILVAVRAEMKAAVSPDYHSKFHYMDVAAMTANLLEKNSEMLKAGTAGAVALSVQQQALTLIAAIGHDIDHDGNANPKDNPLFNEEKSFGLMAPLLEEAGLSQADAARIHTILMTTSPNGPHKVLKEAAHAKRSGLAVDFSKLDPQGRFPELQMLALDPALLQMAAIVSDADLYPSGGAGLASNKLMSELLTAEGKGAIDFTRNAARKFFLENIVGQEGFTSGAGREIANETFKAMRAETERRLAWSPFNGSLAGENFRVDYYQTPDGQKAADGSPLRIGGRYSKEKGYDSAQQDNALVLPDAPDLQPAALGGIFSDIAERMRKNPKFAGSGTTASVAHVSKDGMLTVAHIGDSSVKLYLRDTKTGKIVNKVQVTTPHDCDSATEEEYKRIEQAGGAIVPDERGTMRLGGHLMLTRALGDFDTTGISAEPETTAHDLKPYFDKGLEVIIAVESDGAAEMTSEMQRLAVINGQPENLARDLTELAAKRGATDNVTSISAVLTGKPDENIIMAVFDGHGKYGAAAAHVAVETLSGHVDKDLRAVRAFNPDMDEAPPALPAAPGMGNKSPQRKAP